jgi:hypothetical protein
LIFMPIQLRLAIVFSEEIDIVRDKIKVGNYTV